MGKIKKLKSNELVGGVNRDDVYPVTSTKAVFDDSNTSQDDINKNRLDRIEELEETMPTTVKSITINGGQRVNKVDENGNVDLTIYSDGGQDYEGLTEVVADLRDIVGENPEEPQSGTLLERVDTLEDAVGTGGSVDQRIENAINSLDSQIVVDYGDTNPHIRGAVQLADGKLARFELEENTSDFDALYDYAHALNETDVIPGPKPSASNAQVNTIYRVPNDPSAGQYTDYMKNGNQMIPLATYDVAGEEAQVGCYVGTISGTALSVTAANNANTSLSAYILKNGGHFKVKVPSAATNTSGGWTLSMNGIAAKQLLYNGETVSSANTWEPGETISIYYDGSVYQASNVQGGGGKIQKALGCSLIPIHGKVSIIGDSISTFAGTMPSGYVTYFPNAERGVTSVNDTWWDIILSATNSKLEVNASWSASRSTNTYGNVPDFYNRTNILGSPDYIFIELGSNDWYNNIALGNYDYDSPIENLSEAQFIPSYIKGIKALINNYPSASIVLFTFIMSDDYATAINNIGKHFNLPVIDMRSYYYKDSSNTHPSKEGMQMVVQDAFSYFISKNALVYTDYDISENNKVEGVPTSYSSLAEALGTNGANIPYPYRRGGVKVKFLQATPATYSVSVSTSDSEPTGTALQAASSITDGIYTASQLSSFSTIPSKLGASEVYYYEENESYTIWTIVKETDEYSEYVQYRLMSPDFNIEVGNWQGVDKEITPCSHNLIESGAISKKLGFNKVLAQPYTEGYRLVFRNDIVADSSWCYTDYIPINGVLKIIWTFSNTSTVETVAAHCILYDSSKKAAAYLNNVGHVNTRKLVFEENANWKYIRVSFRKDVKTPLVINGVSYCTDTDRGMTGISLEQTILSQYGIYSFGHSDISTAIFAKRGYRDEISTPNIDRGNWVKIAYFLPGPALVNVSCTGYQLYAGVWSNIETGERVTDEGKLDVISAWTNNSITNFSTTHKGVLTILIRKSGGADITDSEYNTILNTLNISIVPNIPSVDTRKPFSDDYWFTNTGARNNNGKENNYYVYVIPCDAGDELYIDASGTKTGMMYMFIKNYIENSATWEYILYNNNVRNTVVNDQTGTATAPEGTKYVVISGFVRDEQAEFTPDVLTINGKNIDLCIDYNAEGVKALGALGDGIVDDYLPLKRAFRRAGRVVVPDGTYLISLPIDLYSNTEVVMGNNATIKRNLNGNLPGGDYFTVLSAYFTATTTAYNGIQNVSVKGGILDMNESINQHGSCVGLMHGQNIVFDGVTFMHVHQGEHFVDLTACKDVKFLNCTFKDMMTASSSTEQIQIDFASIPVAYPYRRFASGSTCYDNTGCENVEISGCVFKLNNYSPAVGNHNPGVHKRIDIHDNFVFGPGVSVSSFNRAAFAFTCNADFDQYGYDPKNNTDLCLIHHNIINDCKYTVITDSRAAGRIYLRDNVINNFTQVKAPDTSQYVELLNNIETSDN